MFHRPNRQPKTGLWMLLWVMLIGISIGGVFYVVMREQSKPIEIVSFSLIPTNDGKVTSQPGSTATRLFDPAYPRLSIPTRGVSAPIVELGIVDGTWNTYGLGSNVGHLIGTSPLMEMGNIGLAGHVEMADGSPGVFADIENMQIGERIFVIWRGEERAYDVSTIQTVNPRDVSVLYSTNTEQLTLITCSDYDLLQDTYLQRVVVVAARVI